MSRCSSVSAGRCLSACGWHIQLARHRSGHVTPWRGARVVAPPVGPPGPLGLTT